MVQNARNPQIIAWNTHGLNPPRLAALELYLSMNRPVAVALSEIRLSPLSRHPAIPAYSCLFKPVSSASAGTALLVAKSHRGQPIVSRRRVDLELSKHVVCAEVKFPFLSFPIVLVSLYHHRTHESIRSQNWSDLKKCLSKLTGLGLPFVAVGDFNAKHHSWDASHQDAFGSDLSAHCASISAVVLNTVFCPNQPTFPRFNSVIDLAATSDPRMVSDTRPDPLSPLVSDHYPLVISLAPDSIPAFSPRVAHTKLDLDNASWDHFSNCLGAAAQSALTEARSTLAQHLAPIESVETINAIVTSSFSEAASLSIPSKRVGPDLKNWWSVLPGIPQALANLRRAHRSKTRHKTEAARQAWLSAKAAWARLSSEAKAKSWQDLCRKIEDPASHRLLWPRFHASVGRDASGITAIADDSQPLPSSLPESLDRLASHYSTVSAALPSVALTPDDDQIIRYVHYHSRSSPDDPLLDRDFSMAELHAALERVRRSASGPDGLSPLFLHHSPPAFRSVLLLLLNHSWSTGGLPKSWLRAHVCPIFKGRGSPPNLPKSYRPISLTSVLVKLLERMLLARLLRFLEGRNFFSRFQSGFRSGHSTLDQIYRLIDRIQAAFSSHSYVSVGFLDIVAAFDTVWHPGLLYKLFRAGIQGRAFRWIRAFLSDRELRVIFGSKHSGWFPVGAGVPQGSILGPILFLIYLNDLPILDAVSVAIFADDIALWPRLNNARGDAALNKALALISDWAKAWHIAFSTSKSVSMVFTRKLAPVTPLPLLLGSATLTRVHLFAYLGILFRPDLRWHDHCNRVISAAFLAAHHVARIIFSTGPSPRVIRQLVLTTVIPVVTYGWPLWSPPTRKHWLKLEAALCLPLRCALGLPANTHRLALQVEFGVVNPRIHHDRTSLAFAHRCHSLPATHPARSVFDQQYSRIPKPRTPKSHLTFGQTVKAIEAEWKIPLDGAQLAQLVSTRASGLSRQLELLHASPFSRSYDALKPPATPCPYIVNNPRPIAVLRGRLRLNRPHFNASLFKRKLSPSPFCPFCPTEQETTQHVVYDCVAHAHARFLLSAGLSACDCPNTLEIISGDVSKIPANIRTEVLSLTATFLSAVNAIRPI